MLKRRSNEGINVKILLDGLGTTVSTMEEQESLPEGHVGPSSVPMYLEDDSAVDVRMAANPWLTGDHVKTVIIDKRLAFTGGMNIAREYRYDWHDMMIELEGPVVDRVQFEFEKAWAHAGLLGDLGYFVRRISPKPRRADDVGKPIRLLFTRADHPEIFLAQRLAAKRARQYIYIQNAYFTDDAMLYELAQARMRGVDVRVIMPLVTDRGPITKNNALAANALLAHGVRVFIYPGMSHIKAAVFDGWACLGSANLDRWSLKLNKELNVATSEPDPVRRLEAALFEVDFERSVELTEPFPERWSDYLIEVVGDYVF
jgi:cardiolipin synthase